MKSRQILLSESLRSKLAIQSFTDHGVGHYKGLEMIDLGDDTNEFVTVEYQDGANLYIPVTNLGVLSRYAGGDPDSVSAHKLGTDRWSKAKQKAAEEIRDKAAELLDIYATRAAKEGYAHHIDEPQYDRFAEGFPFELTPDQETSIEAVLSDLKAPRPMDRLVVVMLDSVKQKSPCAQHFVHQ